MVAITFDTSMCKAGKNCRIKVFGELPDIVVQVSDERFLKLLELLLSIPTPVPEKEVDALGTRKAMGTVEVFIFFKFLRIRL